MTDLREIDMHRPQFLNLVGLYQRKQLTMAINLVEDKVMNVALF